MNISFTGFVEFKDNIHPFVFNNGKLTIMPADIESFSSIDIEWFNDFNFNYKTELDIIMIEGITEKREKVFFNFVDDYSYKNGNYVYDVDYVYICDYNDGLNIDGLKFKGNEINYFYNVESYLKQEYQFNGNTINKYHFELSSNPDTCFGKCQFHNYSITLKGSMSWKKENDTYSPVELSSLLIIELSRKCKDLDRIYELIHITKSVFSFLCCRKNIVFDEIKTFTFTDGHLKKDIGSLYFFKNDNNEDLTRKEFKHMITSNKIENRICELFSLQIRNKIYLSHISESYKQRNIYTSLKMLSILIAFEHYFSELCPDLHIVSNEFLTAQEETIDFLNLKIDENHGRLKNKYKFLKRSVSKTSDSYMNSLKKSIEDNIDCLKPFIKIIYRITKDEDINNVIESCSERSNEIRNNMAHGNLDFNFDVDNSRDIKLIEILIYSMILKYIGIESNIITEKLAILFNYNI